MDEITNKVTTYATMIKSVDANAQIVGPEISGFNYYFYSGYDMCMLPRMAGVSFPIIIPKETFYPGSSIR